ncbi:MAG: branched-chain amino acid ABC transporter permease [Syntrophorhabdales bacterium]
MSNAVSSARDEKKRSKVGPFAAVVLVVLFLAAIPLFTESPYLLHVLNLTFLGVLGAVSFRTIIISGQFPLGHAAFVGIGAYASGMMAKWLGWSPWLTIPLGTFVATAVGIIIGYPFSRLRAVYYAMVSLFFGIAIVQIINAGGVWSGGYSGLTSIPPLMGFSKTPYYYLFLIVTLASLLVLYRFETCRVGITWKAVAQSYLIASSVGVNEAFYRVYALAVGCFFAGLAGALYAHYNFTIGTSSFDFVATVMFLMCGVVGGMFSFVGPILGTALLVLAPEAARGLKQYVPYISAGILLIVVYGMPQGLIGLPAMIKRLFARRANDEAGRAHHAS